MNPNIAYLPNDAFAPFLGLQNTRFGQWVNSGFESKKKRDAQTTTTTLTTTVVDQSNDGVITDASSTGDSYEGAGIGSYALSQVTPTYNFGHIPSLGALVSGSSATGATGATQQPSTAKTNWIGWSVVLVVVSGVVYGVWKYKKSKGTK